MFAFLIIDYLDVIEDVVACVFTCLVGFATDALVYKQAEEAFNDRIITENRGACTLNAAGSERGERPPVTRPNVADPQRWSGSGHLEIVPTTA